MEEVKREEVNTIIEGTHPEGGAEEGLRPVPAGPSYWDLAGTRPYGMEAEGQMAGQPGPGPSARRGRLHAWEVILFFLGTMLIFLTIGALIQYWLGLAGLAITEIGLLILSVGYALIRRTDLREVFPVGRLKASGIGGVLVLWMAVYSFSNMAGNLMLFLFPDQTLGLSEGMGEVLVTDSLPLLLLVGSLLPAICEEAMHRGIIQNGLRNDIRSPWAVILLTGLIFGLFHVHPLRMLATGFIGGVLAYMLMVTDNMLYGCLLHFLHNGFLFGISYLAQALTAYVPSGEETAQALITPAVMGGSLLLYGIPLPILLYTGSWLMRKAGARGENIPFLPVGSRRSTLLWIFLSTGSMIMIGFIFILADLLAG